jgi:hypothetical protein
MSNSWLQLWDYDNPIENRSEINFEVKFSTNPMLKDETKKNKHKK